MRPPQRLHAPAVRPGGRSPAVPVEVVVEQLKAKVAEGTFKQLSELRGQLVAGKLDRATLHGAQKADGVVLERSY